MKVSEKKKKNMLIIIPLHQQISLLFLSRGKNIAIIRLNYYNNLHY